MSSCRAAERPIVRLGGRSRMGADTTVKTGDRPAVGVAKQKNSRALSAGESADLGQVVPDQPFVGLAQAQEAELAQGDLDPGVGVLARGDGEVERGGTGQEGAYLLEGLKVLGMQFHDHSPMIPKPAPSGSLAAGFTPSVRAHLPLDKAHIGRTVRLDVEWRHEYRCPCHPPPPKPLAMN